MKRQADGLPFLLSLGKPPLFPPMNKIHLKSLLSSCLFFLILLAACSPRRPLATSTPVLSPTAMPSINPTLTPTQTPTTIRTPPVLPDLFQTTLLNPLDTPHTYLPDTCQYLHDRWSPTNSEPGTIVLTIMFHSITNKTVSSPDQISEYNFRLLMNALHEKGFQAITTTQLLDFMETNAKIPPRARFVGCR